MKIISGFTAFQLFTESFLVIFWLTLLNAENVHFKLGELEVDFSKTFSESSTVFVEMMLCLIMLIFTFVIMLSFYKHLRKPRQILYADYRVKE